MEDLNNERKQESTEKYTYDQAMIAELKKISNEAFDGDAPTFTWQEVLKNINTIRGEK